MILMIQTAILVTAVLAVRRIFGDKLHAYIRYGLWLLVVLRLLIPVNFIDSPWSMTGVIETAAQKYGNTLYNKITAHRQTDGNGVPDGQATGSGITAAGQDGIRIPEDQWDNIYGNASWIE